MIEALTEKILVFSPPCVEYKEGDFYLLVDPLSPRWIATDERGARVVRSINGKNSVSQIVGQYRLDNLVDQMKAWVDCTNFLREILRVKFITTAPLIHPPYMGRFQEVSFDKIEEVWLHTNNSCNLSCSHCLVSSSPQGGAGLSFDQWERVIIEARELGAKTFFITGGEPFVRKDIADLIDLITGPKIGGELTILTNAMLFKGERLEKLKKFLGRPLFFQVSLDGATAETNDKIRGIGCFEGTLEGIHTLRSLGFDPVIATAVTSSNHHEIALMPKLIQELGCERLHLMWVHLKGRMMENSNEFEIPISKVIAVVRETKKVADERGIEIDNFLSIRHRVNSASATKYDLSSAGYSSVCIGYDGIVYPSASFVDEEEMNCGSVLKNSLKEIWENSPTLNKLRQATLSKKEICKTCNLKYLCGGGDIEHGYFYSRNKNILGHDPYCDLHQYFLKDSMFHGLYEKKKAIHRNTGYQSPRLYDAMGEQAVDCGNSQNIEKVSFWGVSTVRSNCVLSYEIDKTRRVVREFYGKAAEAPQKGLCCPTTFNADEVSHIPKDIIDRFYGCGSPVSEASVQPGEIFLDLGSGGGIDCFMASKRVGESGKVIGVDMTEEMLGIAHENKRLVEKNLGFSNIEFRQGFLESLPVENKSIDIVTSNCVINLSPDKKMVFQEIWRVLKDHGRVVISDIVTNVSVPSHLRINPRLWGECLSGALTENEFISYLEQASFYGLHLLKKVYWKTVQGYDFYSVTVRGYKFEKKKGCQFIGHKAIYRGPFKAMADEEGHLFMRDETVEICTDTAAKLSQPPYKGSFTVLEPSSDGKEFFETIHEQSCCEGTNCY